MGQEQLQIGEVDFDVVAAGLDVEDAEAVEAGGGGFVLFGTAVRWVWKDLAPVELARLRLESVPFSDFVVA